MLKLKVASCKAEILSITASMFSDRMFPVDEYLFGLTGELFLFVHNHGAVSFEFDYDPEEELYSSGQGKLEFDTNEPMVFILKTEFTVYKVKILTDFFFVYDSEALAEYQRESYNLGKDHGQDEGYHFAVQNMVYSQRHGKHFDFDEFETSEESMAQLEDHLLEVQAERFSEFERGYKKGYQKALEESMSMLQERNNYVAKYGLNISITDYDENAEESESDEEDV